MKAARKKPGPKPKIKPEVLEPSAESPPEPISNGVDELAEALRCMVAAAEAAGGRDRPDVAAAREVLAKHGKYT